MNADQAVAHFLEELRQARPDKRWDAAVKLGNLGRHATNAIPALQDALSDRDAMVRQAAQDAIDKIQNGYEPDQISLPQIAQERPEIPTNYNEVIWYRRSGT